MEELQLLCQVSQILAPVVLSAPDALMPGHVEESKKILEIIAEEISTGVHISLLSQYYPTPLVNDHPDLKIALYKSEYESVVETMENLGFRNGWIQEMDSYRSYRPDFRKENPFES